jgi:hypothetical protein
MSLSTERLTEAFDFWLGELEKLLKAFSQKGMCTNIPNPFDNCPGVDFFSEELLKEIFGSGHDYETSSLFLKKKDEITLDKKQSFSSNETFEELKEQFISLIQKKVPLMISIQRKIEAPKTHFLRIQFLDRKRKRESNKLARIYKHYKALEGFIERRKVWLRSFFSAFPSTSHINHHQKNLVEYFASSPLLVNLFANSKHFFPELKKMWLRNIAYSGEFVNIPDQQKELLISFFAESKVFITSSVDDHFSKILRILVNNRTEEDDSFEDCCDEIISNLQQNIWSY